MTEVSRNKSKTRAILKYGGLTVASAALIASAHAEDAKTLDTVTVTTQKREQSILDVPAAVSAVSAETLEAAGVTRLDDLSTSFPNVYLNTNNSLRTTTITIRGVASNPNNPGVDQGVGVFVDGIYQSRPTTINTNLYDLERVEVVRGPQGALYGKNTIAGAVNLISKLPGDKSGVEGVLSLGDYEALTLFGAADLVISDKVKARVSASSQRREGFTENTFTGSDLNDLDGTSMRFAVVVDPVDSLQLIWRGDFAEDRTNLGGSEVLNNGVLSGSPLADADPEDFRISNDFDPVQNRDLWGTSLQADWSIGTGKLTSLTAYRDYQWYNASDNDFTVLNQLRSGITEEQNQFSQELRYTSAPGDTFDYIVGAYFLKEELSAISNAVIGPDLGVYAAETPIDIFADLETTSYAIFGQANYYFNEALGISAALRAAHDEKEVIHSSIGDPYGALLPTLPESKQSREDNEWTPSISLNWNVGADGLVYASYARGYKSGGFNVFSISPTDSAEYSPEFVNSYELGAKSSFANGTLYGAAAVFFLDYTDLQVNQLINVGGVPTFTTSNAAEAESWGIELEGNWMPIEDLVLTASYGYLNGEYSDFENATSAGADYSGNTLPEAPEHSASLAGNYRHPLTSALDFTLHGDANYRSEVFFSASNEPDYTQDAVTLVNARIGVAAADDSWSVTLWGRNLTDETYAVGRSAGVIIPGQQIQSLGAPRTVGIELRGKF
ncbi:TonB-dependent receptor [Henriciella litoralis]|uniref:TonB-dependent receptor n=1 Tax=Henriciella litoralis TaxID=568102 RepID=UPI00146D17A6|nr:TonB-dependent receptor [Henriciella litoralis]